MAAKGLGNRELPGGAKEAAKMAAVSSRVLAHCWLLTLVAVSAACFYKFGSLENGNGFSPRISLVTGCT
jgi:hypothetical protein